MTKKNFSEMREMAETMQVGAMTQEQKHKLKIRLRKLSEVEIEELVESIDNFYLTPSEFVSGDYFYCNSNYYSESDFVETRDGDACRREDANFCQYYDEYTTQNLYTCYIDRRSYEYCTDAIDRLDLYYFEGSYYDDNALERNDLCIIDGDIYNQDECYFYDGEWNLQPEQEFVRDYHHDTRTKFVKFSDTPAFFIGFEIEKEDESVKQSITLREFESQFSNWRKERDGSLDGDSGYELVSPAFELNIEGIAKELDNEILQRHINAKYSDSCGGHLNISRKGYSGQDFFDTIEGYTPLIYALYPKRLKVDFCKGKSNKSLKNDCQRYQAIAIHSNYIEYRIFSAIPNVETLIWRTKLMKAICDNPTNNVTTAFLNANSVLKSVLMEQYSTPDRFQRLMDRVVKYTMNYEGINPKGDNDNPIAEN